MKLDDVNIEQFRGLFIAITNIRRELNMFGYDVDTLTIRKGINIDKDTEFPDKMCGLKILLNNK